MRTNDFLIHHHKNLLQTITDYILKIKYCPKKVNLTDLRMAKAVSKTVELKVTNTKYSSSPFVK